MPRLKKEGEALPKTVISQPEWLGGRTGEGRWRRQRAKQRQGELRAGWGFYSPTAVLSLPSSPQRPALFSPFFLSFFASLSIFSSSFLARSFVTFYLDLCLFLIFIFFLSLKIIFLSFCFCIFLSFHLHLSLSRCPSPPPFCLLSMSLFLSPSLRLSSFLSVCLLLPTAPSLFFP